VLLRDGWSGPVATLVGKVHEVQVVDGRSSSRPDPCALGPPWRQRLEGRDRTTRGAIATSRCCDAARARPHDLRSLFYLAQTRGELGTMRRAGVLRAARPPGRLGEEVYQSLFHIGLLKAELGDWAARWPR